MSDLHEAIRAVAYLRMSTDRQRYSIESQIILIREYAAQHGFEIVRLYADEAHSGLSIDKRSALKALIEEVKSGGCDFSAILVYDVSRWGRFQDCDESAYYEYLCSRAGVRVHYCAEPFDNDRTLAATLMKALKRAMAGEYSRELSEKVFKAHSMLAARGFRQGGTPGYGMRRQAIDEHGIRQTLFERGQPKSIKTHRVVLVPGPPDEVAIVRRVYSLFVVRKYSACRIAKLLNKEGVPRKAVANRWDYQAVMEILTNEKYVGCNVYNKVSRKLGGRSVKNDESKWVVEPNAFEAIVSSDLFEKAQRMRSKRCSYKKEALLLHLVGLLRTFGFLSTRLIDAHADLGRPCSATYWRRFGSLDNAFNLIGYEQLGRAEVLKRVADLSLRGKPRKRATELKKQTYKTNHSRHPSVR